MTKDDEHECESRWNGMKRYLVGVGIAVTTSILMQSACLIWWAATITTRMGYVERDVARLTVRMDKIEHRGTP